MLTCRHGCVWRGTSREGGVQDKKKADGGERMKNIRKVSKACKDLITVKSC